jgi:NitT/TauT family transport system substrate-binding protein
VTLDAAAKRLFCLLVIVPSLARAEVREVHCAQQFGLSYLALMMMEDGRLVEKQAEKLGLSGLKTTWSKFGGVGPMNDALLSGRVDFSAGGVPSVATLWAKTKGTPLEVRGVGALNNMPVELITSDPEVKSIRDFGPKDKIAVPTVKMSNQALFLEMGAAKEFGEENYEKLDALTVTMPHPDALAAMLSHSGGITAHFSSPPYQGQEKAKGMHSILTNYQVLGGPATFNLVWTTTKFRADNPKAYAAFAAALEEATEAINRDRRGAAEIYKRMSGTKESIDELVKQLSDPQVEFTLTPSRSLLTAQFMYRIGRIKAKPASWKDLFFPDVHGRPGS